MIDFRFLVRSPLLTALGAAAIVLPAGLLYVGAAASSAAAAVPPAPQVHEPVPMVSTPPDFRALVQRGESRVFVPIEPG